MLLALLLVGCTPAPTRPAGPNLLLVTIDALRADHVGAWGYDRATTPALNALAHDGTRFTSTFTAASLTTPSLLALQTSLHPIQHGLRANGAPRSRNAKVVPTLAAALCAPPAHRTCAAFLTNPSTETQWSGFTTYSREVEDDGAVDHAIRWLETKPADQSFFLWVHLWGPHDPYVKHPGAPEFTDPDYAGAQDGTVFTGVKLLVAPAPHPVKDVQHVVDMYDGEVAWTDHQVSRLTAALAARGLGDSTLVVATADHGEELDDHPPFLYHSASVWDGVLHIPLIFSQPGVVPAGGSTDIPASICDVAPTILDLFGIAQPEGWSGRSLLPAMLGERMEARPVLSELAAVGVVVHDDRYVAILNPSEAVLPMAPASLLGQAGIVVPPIRLGYAMPRGGLYDWRADPLEHVDLAKGDPANLERLRAIAAAWEKEVGWPGEVSPGGVMTPLQQRLEALGYAQP